jgi:hypothetical protein
MPTQPFPRPTVAETAGQARLGEAKSFRLSCWGLGMLLILAGCASTPLSRDDETASLKAAVETLYLNYHALEAVHAELHLAVLQGMAESDDGFREIQSAARFVRQGNLIAYYQWQLIALTPYIDRDRQRDFFTLRFKDLDDARQKTKDLMLQIKVYAAFIHDQRAQSALGRSLELLEAHIASYGEIMAQIESRRNPTRPNLPREGGGAPPAQPI